ncbi:putative 1,3-beta-glucanosyltransferase [Naematelia encephala]|uniref:1,3-beta-glucanosyltransferase n=1 Tax=Naematelia encephala TaxID=71784 RepID=A0A1Y2ASG1_9TREE|nr:putative 1,3-beta-glucanosyltransferase [Naematelia encephala]
MRFLAAIAALPLAFALPQISRTGKYLYDPTGARFYIKGVAYQPEGQLAASSEANNQNGGFPEPSSFVDPLSSSQNCTRDIPYLRQLGVNAVRVYSVNSSLNHDACMSMLEDAGIYVMLDVSLPLNGSIDRSSPAWSTNLLDEYTTTIDAFTKYDNILAFNVGNEVINLVSNTNAAPYVKAAARDIKAYLKSVNSSALVGYSAVDGDADFRNTLAEYMTCGDDDVRVDIYGLNNYEWCGNETLTSSNWNTITQGFSNIAVATYMSEYGCIFSPPRLWTEVTALFASPVSDVFSGGVAFSYFPTSDGYGMVTFSDDGSSVVVSDDFTRLSAEYNSTNGPNSPAQSASSDTTGTCPGINATLLASTTLPPTPDESVCNCVNQNALACRIIPATANQPAVVGSLTDYTCSLLGSSGSGASCDVIGGNGTAGTYGELSFCSPAIKLSYAMSAYYEFNPISTSCDFSGNATLNPQRPNTGQDASTAASQCLAQIPSGGVFTPTPSATGSQTAPQTGSSSQSASASASASSSASGAASRGAELVGSRAVVGLVLGFIGVTIGAAAVF